MLTLTYPDGERLSYGYDAAGQLVSVVGQRHLQSTTYVSDLQYNEFGVKTKAVFGNGMVSTWDYDSQMLRLTAKQTQNPQTGGFIQDLSYPYDLEGNPTQITSNLQTPSWSGMPGPGSLTFTYDTVDRLVTAVGQHTLADQVTTYTQDFFYDSIHNLTRKTRVHEVTPNGGDPFHPDQTNIDLPYS